MRCLNCQHVNEASARYCAHCGAELLGPEKLSPGQTMNQAQYRVVRQLGEGGMGAIYLAQNTQAFGRLCVIKQLIAYAEPGEELKAQERFEAEARTLAALKHPGIPDMYGYFSERGRNYIVMEYIEGQNLEQAMADLPANEGMAPELAARYGIEICRVLEYLAQVQPEPVVHCDLKPANIIIERNSQQAVLVDFGTARARYAHAKTQAPDGDRPSVYGTVGYAAPELYRGQVVAKSDVFSLAATLYHLLSHDDPREHPFKWPQLAALPREWRLLLERALATEIAERLDATQFRQQMESYRAAQAGTIQPLTFPGGNLATTLTGVLDLSLRYWEYARQMLYDGSLDAWLRQTLHDPVAADRAREAVQTYGDAPDAGLDTFVRGLNPRLPRPTLRLSAERIDLGELDPTAPATTRLTLRNEGPGGANGAVVPGAPWLEVAPERFALGPGQQQELAISVRRDALPKQGPLEASLTVRSTGGAELAAVVAARRRPTKKASVRPKRAAPCKPAASPTLAQPTPRRSFPGIVWLLLALVLLAGGAALLSLRGSGEGLSASALERGLAAIEVGDWERAQRLLSPLAAADTAQVEAVAAALDAQMVPLAGGTLSMGSDEAMALDQRPEHPVTLDAFAIDRCEVTNAQYQRFIYRTGHAAPRGWTGNHFPAGQALYPVANVTWDDAQAYAAWAHKRLPTEAEWEWAARGAAGREYPWGGAADASPANTFEAHYGGAAPVGAFDGDVTPQGVLDLGGNVREWTADRYGPYQVPHAPTSEGEEMAVRGSSWDTYQDAATARQREPRSAAAGDLGFRCVR